MSWEKTKDKVCGDGNGQWHGWRCSACERVMCTREGDMPKHCDCESAVALKDGDYSRENLIAICEAAVVNVDAWQNRDSPSAHEKLGLCWVMLKAGCKFHVHPSNDESNGCFTNNKTIWLTIEWPTFSSFEYGGGHETDELFYIPTPKRLSESRGRDWY